VATVTDDFHQLVNRCLAGEQHAMAALIDRYKSAVFGLCYRMLGHRQDAEDAAQETFVRVLRSLHRWDADRQFEPWLLTIAGNRCRTMLQRRTRRPAAAALVEAPADETSPELQAAQQLAEEVSLALEQLRPEYRQAFVLFSEHELSYAEIAEVMDIPLGTVKTWVHRARRELISHLDGRGVLEEPRNEMRRV
jgi:RNA polymerase sigma-70 factor, ECF subfamily